MFERQIQVTLADNIVTFPNTSLSVSMPAGRFSNREVSPQVPGVGSPIGSMPSRAVRESLHNSVAANDNYAAKNASKKGIFSFISSAVKSIYSSVFGITKKRSNFTKQSQGSLVTPSESPKTVSQQVDISIKPEKASKSSEKTVVRPSTKRRSKTTILKPKAPAVIKSQQMKTNVKLALKPQRLNSSIRAHKSKVAA